MVIHATLKIGMDSRHGEVMILILDLYACANSVITIIFVKPYKQFLTNKFYGICEVITCGKLKLQSVNKVQDVIPSNTSTIHTVASVI